MIQTYTIEKLMFVTEHNAKPEEGCWYSGVTHDGKTGAVVKHVGGQFWSSASDLPIDMTVYARLQKSTMALTAVQHPVYKPQHKEVRLALQWLRTLIASEAVTWDPNQKQAAQEALDEAAKTLGQESHVAQH